MVFLFGMTLPVFIPSITCLSTFSYRTEIRTRLELHKDTSMIISRAMICCCDSPESTLRITASENDYDNIDDRQASSFVSLQPHIDESFINVKPVNVSLSWSESESEDEISDGNIPAFDKIYGSAVTSSNFKETNSGLNVYATCNSYQTVERASSLCKRLALHHSFNSSSVNSDLGKNSLTTATQAKTLFQEGQHVHFNKDGPNKPKNSFLKENVSTEDTKEFGTKLKRTYSAAHSTIEKEDLGESDLELDLSFSDSPLPEIDSSCLLECPDICEEFVPPLKSSEGSVVELENHAAVRDVITCDQEKSILPVLKKELQCKIKLRRFSQGEPDINLTADEPKTYEVICCIMHV